MKVRDITAVVIVVGLALVASTLATWATSGLLPFMMALGGASVAAVGVWRLTD